MDMWVWIVIGVVVAVVVLGVLVSAPRTRRSRSLQDRFGREYDRTADKAGSRREAEQELRKREKRHDELELRPLSQDVRERYLQQWQATQGRFVDDPTGAVSKADELVRRVMQERGYPVSDFEQRAADISVEHPELVEKYRTADGIARASERGEASTEDLRHSVRHTVRSSSSCSRLTATPGKPQPVTGSSTTSSVCARSIRSTAPCSATDRSPGRCGAHARQPTSARAASSDSPSPSVRATRGRRCAGTRDPFAGRRSTADSGRSTNPRSGGCRATDACGADSGRWRALSTQPASRQRSSPRRSRAGP